MLYVNPRRVKFYAHGARTSELLLHFVWERQYRTHIRVLSC
jgi:hypothetical protein